MKDTSMQLLRIGGLKLSTDSFVAFFCRGSEGQREFKKLSFKFEADASWGRFVTKVYNKGTKTHKGGVCDVLKRRKVTKPWSFTKKT